MNTFIIILNKEIRHKKNAPLWGAFLDGNKLIV